MTEISQSPVPQQVGGSETMDFPDAIRRVIAGKKIIKLEWKNKDIYGFLNGDILSLHKEDGKNYQWVINEGDLLGTDWVVLG